MQSSWITAPGEPSPRNAWRWFRGTIDLAEPPSQTTLTLSADTRFQAWINGVPVADGPARGWPERWFTDSVEVGHLLTPGRNVVAVQVHHLGIATFATLRGRLGLIAELVDGDGRLLLGTGVAGSRWRVHTPVAFATRTTRLSCQLGFTEIVDARTEDLPGWTRPDFDDSGWAEAEPDPIGTLRPPLEPRDVPPLQAQPVRAVRVETWSRVRPPRDSRSIDLRRVFGGPAVDDHAERLGYAGWLFAAIRVPVAGAVALRLPRHVQSVSVGGARTAWQDLSEVVLAGSGQQVDGVREWRGELEPGDHLVVLEVRESDHAHTVHLVLDADAEVSFTEILPGSDLAFADSGGQVLSRWDLMDPELPELDRQLQARTAALTGVEEVSALPGVRPVPPELVSPVSLFGTSVLPSRYSQPVQTGLQQQIPAGLDAVLVPAGADLDSDPAPDVEVLVDLGRVLAGEWSFEITAPEGTVVDLYAFEHCDGEPGQPLRREETLLLDNCLRYVCAEGRQRWTSPIRRGGRHLQLTVRRPAGASGAVVLHDLHVVERHHPVGQAATFACSDPRLEQIWQMARRTVLACMEDTFVDCPTYEQTMWVGDSYSSGRFATALFGSDDLVRRCLRLVAGSLVRQPLTGSHIPSGWDSVIPGWTYFWVLAVGEHWQRTGSVEDARLLWPAVRDTLTAHRGHLDDRGLLSIDAWNLLDWAALDQPDSGVVTHQNLLLVMALRAGAVIAEAAGEPIEVGAELTAAADGLAAAIEEHLWDEDTGGYLDAIHADGSVTAIRSVHSQLFALLAGVPGGERLERVRTVLLDPPAGWVPLGSPWMSIFHYDALALLGREQQALDELRRDFGAMLDHGAATCWEMFPSSNFLSGSRRLSRSHCHAWSGAPASFVSERLLGIRFLTPGGSRIEVAPVPCDLDWARGSIPHPAGGSIEVSWRLVDGRLEISASAPPGVELVAPDGTPLN